MHGAFSKARGGRAERNLDQFTQWELSPGIDVTFMRPFEMPAFTPASLGRAMATVGTMKLKCHDDLRTQRCAFSFFYFILSQRQKMQIR